MPTSCCILVYDREGDGIDWHYDVNYYFGRFFTVDEITSRALDALKS